MDDLHKSEDQNQQPTGLPQAPAMPQSDQPKPPPPPPPEITIRTMKSDLESLKETGGTAPTPKPFTPPEFKKELPKPPIPPTPPPPPSRITPTEFETSKQEEALSTETPSVIEEESASPKSIKKLLLWSGAVVIVIGIGLLGYFVVFPLLFPTQPAPLTPPPVPAPIDAAEIPVSSIPEAETTVPEIPAAEALKAHQSLLSSSDGASEVQLSVVDLQSLNNALQIEAQKENPSGSLIEIIFSDTGGQINSAKLISTLLPEAAQEVAAIFNNDFTAALYYDNNGVWPAYILSLSQEASIVEAQAIIADLEQSQNLSNFFLFEPGIPNSAGFKDGQANARYLTFSQQGAALNIAWADDKLIISTSYSGLKKILNNL